MTATTEYLSVAETAKLVRAALKRRFPDAKDVGRPFSVRSRSYSMGASIDVRWTDGPTEAMVREVTDQFAGGRFDGMIDLKYHAEHWLMPDGTTMVRREYGHSFAEAEVHNEDRPVPAGARLVRFGADHVFATRDLSPAFKALIEAKLVEDWGSRERWEEQNRRYWDQGVWLESQKWQIEDGHLEPFEPTDEEVYA
jgi:hypothetical protein